MVVFTPAVYCADPNTALAWLEGAFGFAVSIVIEAPMGSTGIARVRGLRVR